MPLGTAGVSLLEMTSAYAAVAADNYPVRPIGISQDQGGSWLNGWGEPPAAAQRGDPALAQLRTLLNGVVTRGTGTGGQSGSANLWQDRNDAGLSRRPVHRLCRRPGRGRVDRQRQQFAAARA
jgi:membrane peptidoglycan carboxypeptidase